MFYLLLGILTEWTIGSPNVKSMPYTGLNVAKITFSQALTVIALRSGTSKLFTVCNLALYW